MLLASVETCCLRFHVAHGLDFLGAWGLDREGIMTRASIFYSQTAPRWFERDDRTDLVISKEIARIRKETVAELALLEFSPTSSVEEKKSRLLYLLVKDLLGSAILQAILERKCVSDIFFNDHPRHLSYRYLYSGKRVSVVGKVLLSGLLCAVVALMLWYIILYAQDRAVQRQEAWLESLIVWIALDLVLFSTLEVYFLQVSFPRLLMKDLAAIRIALLHLVTDFNQSTLRNYRTARQAKNNLFYKRDRAVAYPTDRERDLTWSSTNHFHTSWRLANYYNDLPEASLILSFRNLLPPGIVRSRSEFLRPFQHNISSTSEPYAARRGSISSGLADNSGSTVGTQLHTMVNFQPRRYPSAFKGLLKNAVVSVFHTFVLAHHWAQDVAVQMWVVIFVGIFALIHVFIFTMNPLLLPAPSMVLVAAWGLAYIFPVRALVTGYTAATTKLSSYCRGNSNQQVAAETLDSTTAPNKSNYSVYPSNLRESNATDTSLLSLKRIGSADSTVQLPYNEKSKQRAFQLSLAQYESADKILNEEERKFKRQAEFTPVTVPSNGPDTVRIYEDEVEEGKEEEKASNKERDSRRLPGRETIDRPSTLLFTRR